MDGAISRDLLPKEDQTVLQKGERSICWKKYGVRPAPGVPNPEKTDYRYCIYDRMHNDYGYTQDWVDFLTEKLRDESELESLYKWPPAAV